jgi:hypothetical protein
MPRRSGVAAKVGLFSCGYTTKYRSSTPEAEEASVARGCDFIVRDLDGDGLCFVGPG